MSRSWQRRWQTRQPLFTLPISPAGDVLSINGNTHNAGDTGFEMESTPSYSCVYHVAILGFPDCLLLMITAVITMLL